MKKEVTQAMLDQAAVLRQEIRASEEALKKIFEDCDRGEVKRAYQKIFWSQSRPLFEKFPFLDSFGWTQGTPSFNDGDPCAFSTHLWGPSDVYINGEKGDNWTNEEYERREDTFEEIHAFLNDYKEVDMLDWFGDCQHITIQHITIHRSGAVEIDDHDCG